MKPTKRVCLTVASASIVLALAYLLIGGRELGTVVACVVILRESYFIKTRILRS